jgi:hypothetical protein
LTALLAVGLTALTALLAVAVAAAGAQLKLITRLKFSLQLQHCCVVHQVDQWVGSLC